MELPNCENDIEIVNGIIKQFGINADIVQQAFRVPRERQKDSPPHKIVVSLTTRYDKSKVLEKASSLRGRGNKWKNVLINKTQKEQKQDYRLHQERRRLKNGEKDLIIYKGEITTKQALQQETGTLSPKQGTKDKATAGAGLPKGRGVGGGRSNVIPLLILYILYTQILTNLTPLELRKLTLKHILTLFLLTSPPNHLTVQLPQTLGEIPLGRRGWVREGMAADGRETLQ